MEKYEIIDIKKLDRADYFYYFISVGTTIEFTVKMDVTKVLEKCYNEKLNFQAVMLHRIYRAINQVDNFKYDLLDGKLIKWDKIVPTFSSMNKNNKLFFTLYADMQENEIDYNEVYKDTVNKYATSTTIVPQGELPGNVFNVSCIPWLHFEHFSSNSKSMENNIVKMITIGKYEQVNDRYVLPITLQVSHAVVDGYHASLFFEKLREELYK